MIPLQLIFQLKHCTEVHFASFLSGGFTIMAVMDPPERKLVKRTFFSQDGKAVVSSIERLVKGQRFHGTVRS